MTYKILKNKLSINKLKKFNIKLIYLFGSRLDGKNNKSSDYDIAVLLPFNLSKKERFNTRLALIELFMNIIKSNRNIDLVILNDIRSLLFKYSIIKEGKLLYQRSENDRISFESRAMSEYFDFQPFLDQYNKAYVKANI